MGQLFYNFSASPVWKRILSPIPADKIFFPRSVSIVFPQFYCVQFAVCLQAFGKTYCTETGEGSILKYISVEIKNL